jgi:hypothetical protein
MSRSYPRDEIKWDLDTLKALAALVPPQATYFEKADRWVVKQDGKSFGVRPEQIIEAVEEDYDDGSYEAEMAYERWLENGGPHALAIQVEDEIEQQREANDPGLQRLRAGRKDDRPTNPEPAGIDDVLAHFGI